MERNTNKLRLETIRIGSIVHFTDAEHCHPFLITSVFDEGHKVKGFMFDEDHKRSWFFDELMYDETKMPGTWHLPETITIC